MKSKESSSNQYAEIYKSSQSAQENTRKSARTKSQKTTESAESNKAVLSHSEMSAALDKLIKSYKDKSNQSSAKGSKKKDDSSIILQVDDITKAIMEQLIAREHNVSSGESDQRIADLENKITNLTDDLKRCNKRIDELEKELSRVKREI